MKTVIQTYRAHWGWMMARGLLTFLAGVFILSSTAVALSTVVLLFAGFVSLTGFLAIAASFTSTMATRGHRLLLATEGIFSIGIGVLAVGWPGITLLFLSYLTAFWAFSLGFTELLTAYSLRHQVHSPILLMVAGSVSLLFGVLILSYPITGALIWGGILAGYCLVYGALTMTWSYGLIKTRTLHPIVPVPETTQGIFAETKN